MQRRIARSIRRAPRQNRARAAIYSVVGRSDVDNCCASGNTPWLCCIRPARNLDGRSFHDETMTRPET